jgi:hypothetical protein
MKAGIRPINYAWQKGDAHNKTEFVIIPSKEPPEARGCRLTLLLFISTLRERESIRRRREMLSADDDYSGCVKINNCSPRSRLIGERRTRGALNLSTAADYSPAPNGKACAPGESSGMVRELQDFASALHHTHTHRADMD